MSAAAPALLKVVLTFCALFLAYFLFQYVIHIPQQSDDHEGPAAAEAAHRANNSLKLGGRIALRTGRVSARTGPRAVDASQRVTFVTAFYPSSAGAANAGGMARLDAGLVDRWVRPRHARDSRHDIRYRLSYFFVLVVSMQSSIFLSSFHLPEAG